MANMDQQKIVLTDIDIPFKRLVWFMVTLGLAAIPAGIILWITMIALNMIFMALFGNMIFK